MNKASEFTKKWIKRRIARGECVQCGTVHNRISQKGKVKARKCMSCALKSNAYAQRIRDARKSVAA